ncbi:MAG: WbqC family protein [Ignavibacteria bacterium]|nr:WbqC family protein [Ignavibacteria bacterium]
MIQEKPVAIHQPSFFPWLGFFDKIIRSEIFVILDDVQFPKKGGYWANRVKIIIAGRDEWLTMPVVRSYSGLRKINEMEIDNSGKWNEKALKTIEINYHKAPFFNQIFPVLNDLFSNVENNLCNYNMKVINTLCNILEISTEKFILSSKIKKDGKGTDLLISIVKSLGKNSYMCGGGASKYQEDEKFIVNGIKLIYQNFRHPVYRQFNTVSFIPGLSVVDMLMNCGIEESRKLINAEFSAN